MNKNLGQMTGKGDLIREFNEAYVEQASGFAAQYYDYKIHVEPPGWTGGWDKHQFEKRLVSKTSACKPLDKDEPYLWNMYTQARSCIELEFLPAFNELTNNGVNLISSGGDVWQLVGNLKQLYWEMSMEREKNKTPDAVKSQIHQHFVQLYGAQEGAKKAICPLDRAGHGKSCKWGHMPQEWTPKLWLVILHLSPVADVINKYYCDNNAYPAGLQPFPAFASTPQFQEIFGHLKSQSGPDAPGEHGGSESGGRKMLVSRAAMKAGALKIEDMKARADDSIDSPEIKTPQTETLHAVRAAANAINQEFAGKNDADLVAAQASMLQARVALVGQLTAAGDDSSQELLRALAQAEKSKVIQEAKRAQTSAPESPAAGGSAAKQVGAQGT